MSFTPYDQEFDNFIDFDNGFHSPAEMRSPTSASATIDPMQSMYHSDASERRQVYSGPSHEYSRYRQLTGLPSGAMTAIPLDTEVKSEFPFSFQPSPSGPSMPYMDFSNTFDFDTPIDPLQSEPLPAYFFPNQTNTFMDTTPVAPQLSMSASAGPSQPQQQGRLWPGMHTQQAQQAQAEALARQQRQQQLGQQIMQQRNMQRQASAVSVASMPASRANSVVSVADSNVDDRISRLLDQMRNNNAMSTIDEEADDGPSEPSGRGKNKKDEEDMDEDERLLASEEGKKLSSKERRQLRNKVSARAFRSRRKEYITQLEGEVAQKTQECDELKRANRHMSEQVAQLTALTRTLLARPEFQTFAEELSHNPSLLAPTSSSSSSSSTSSTSTVRPTASTQQSQQQQSSSQPEVSQQEPEQQQYQGTMQDNSLNFSMLNLGNSHPNGYFNFQQPQVFAVYELPQPAELPVRSLSGKDDKEDVLSKILSPIKLASIAAPSKPQQPHISVIKPAHEEITVAAATVAPTGTSSSPFSTASPQIAERDIVGDINAAFDSLDQHIQSLSTLVGYSSVSR